MLYNDVYVSIIHALQTEILKFETRTLSIVHATCFQLYQSRWIFNLKAALEISCRALSRSYEIVDLESESRGVISNLGCVIHHIMASCTITTCDRDISGQPPCYFNVNTFLEPFGSCYKCTISVGGRGFKRRNQMSRLKRDNITAPSTITC